MRDDYTGKVVLCACYRDAHAVLKLCVFLCEKAAQSCSKHKSTYTSFEDESLLVGQYEGRK